MRRRRKLTKREWVRRRRTARKNRLVKMAARRTYQRPAEFALTETSGEQTDNTEQNAD